MASNKYANPEKTFAFGFRAFKKYPEIFPLCAVLGVAAVGTVAYGIYSFTKLDVIVNRKNALPPWERVDLINPKVNKLLIMNQECKANPELIQLKEDMK